MSAKIRELNIKKVLYDFGLLEKERLYFSMSLKHCAAVDHDTIGELDDSLSRCVKADQDH